MAEATLVVLCGVFVPLPRPVVDPASALVLGAMTLCVYAGMSLLSFSFRCSYQLPAWIYYLFFLVRPFDRAMNNGAADPWLTRPWPWLGGAVVLLALLAGRLVDRTLHRRLSGTMVLAPEDIFRAGRLQTYKELRARHQRPGAGMRWRGSLLDRILGRAAAAKGDGTTHRAWLLVHAGLAQSITRRRWVLALIGVAIAIFFVTGGYMDAWQADGELDGWFAGLVYAWATMPLAGTFLAMNHLTAMPSPRRAGLRSEMLVVAWTAAAAALLAAAIGGVFALLEATLPALEWRGGTITYAVSSWHGMALVPLLAPAVWLAVALRPRPRSTLPTLILIQGFLLGHILMTAVPVRIALPAFAVLMAAAGLAAWTLRRRWWRTADRPV
jgi:hypothetical protein